MICGSNMNSDSIDANNINYDNTDSGLEATDVQGAVDELAEGKAAKPYTQIVKVTTDGVKTYKALINELFTTEGVVINSNSDVILKLGTTRYYFTALTSSTFGFVCVNGANIYNIAFDRTDGHANTSLTRIILSTSSGITINDMSSTVHSSGSDIILYGR